VLQSRQQQQQTYSKSFARQYLDNNQQHPTTTTMKIHYNKLPTFEKLQDPTWKMKGTKHSHIIIIIIIQKLFLLISNFETQFL